MLIPIKRVYLESGIVAEVIVNTNYIYKISKNVGDPTKPNTRILMIGFGNEPDIFYTNEQLSTIKSKYTRAKNKNQEREE